MSYLSPNLEASLRAEIKIKEEQLAAANTALTAALSNSEVAGYKFNSGEGDQYVSRRKPQEIQESITILESAIARLYNRLYGRGVVNMNLRRRR